MCDAFFTIRPFGETEKVWIILGDVFCNPWWKIGNGAHVCRCFENLRRTANVRHLDAFSIIMRHTIPTILSQCFFDKVGEFKCTVTPAAVPFLKAKKAIGDNATVSCAHGHRTMLWLHGHVHILELRFGNEWLSGLLWSPISFNIDILIFHCPYLIHPQKKLTKNLKFYLLEKAKHRTAPAIFWVPAVNFPEVYTWQELILQIRLQASMREMKNHHIHSIS